VHTQLGRPTTVRVRPGDSLWLIAERALGPGATDARVAAYWPRIRARNAAVIGDDPDLIRPDQRLQLPPTHEE
jgi:nucleoid-associated protein YgaU